MAQDFNIGIGVVAKVDETKIQNDIKKQTKNVKLNVDVNVDKTSAQKAIQNIFDKDKLDKQGREYFTKTTGILKQVKDYYKKNGAISIDITNQQKANGQIKSFTATVTEATGIIKKFNYERGKINTGGAKANYGFVQTNNVTALDKLSGSKLKQTDDFLAKIQNRITDINSKTFNQSKSLLSVENSDKYNNLLSTTENKITAIKNSTKILSDDHKREIGTMIADLDRYRKELQNVEYAGTKLKPDTFTDTKAILQSQLGTNIQKWDSSKVFDGAFKKNVLDAKALLDNATNPEGLDKYRSKLKLLTEDFKQITQSSKNVNNINKLNDSISITKTRAESANKNLSTYIKSLNPSVINKYSKEIKNISTSFDEVQKTGDKVQFSKATSQLSNFKSNIKEAGLETKSFSRVLKDDISKFAQWTLSATILMQSINSIKNLISTVYTMDESITNLRMVTGGSISDTQTLVNSYSDLAQELGATTTEVVTSANEWLRMGKSVEESSTLIKNSMILAKDAQLDSASATTYLTSAMLGYKVATEDTLKIIDMLTSVDMEAAVSAGGIAEAMSKTASSANLAGVSMEKLISYLTVVGEVSQKDMSSIGESFKTIFARMGNVKLGSLTDEDGNDITSEINDVETILNKVDIKLRDSATSFRDFDDVLDEVGKNWNSFNEVEKSAIATTFAGVRQRENYIILMENYSNSLKYAETAANSSGTALEKFSYFEESASAKANRLKSSLEELAMDTLDSSLIKGLLDSSNALVTFVDNVGLLNTALLVTSAVLGGKGTLIMLPKLATSLGGVATSFGVSAEAAGVFGAALSNILPIMAVMAAIKIYDELNVTLKEQQEITSNLNSEYNETQSKLSDINSELETTQNRIDELNGKENLTFIEKDELENLKETNTQLESQNRLLQEQADIKNKEIAESVTKEYQKDMQSNALEKTYWSGKDKQYYDTYTGTSGTAKEYINTNEEDYLKNILEQYKQYISLKEKGVEFSKEDSDYYQQIREDLVSAGTKYNEYADNYKIDDATSQSWRDFASLIDKTLNPEEYKTKSFDEIFNSDSFATAKKEIEELAKVNPISGETISSNKEYKKLIEATGLSAKEIAIQINALFGDIADSTINATTPLKSYKDIIDEFSAKTKLLAEAQYELSESGNLSYDTVSDLLEAYPELENELSLTKDGYTLTKDALDNLMTSQTSEYELAYNDAVDACNKFIDNEKLKKAGIDQTTTSVKNQMYAMIKLYEQQQQASGDTLREIQNSSTYQSMLSAWSSITTSESNYEKSKKVVKDIQTETTNDLKDKEKDKKDDPYLDAYNVEKDALDHKLAMDEITESQYYDKLEKLNNEYFAKHKKKYLSQYNGNQEEIYKGRKQLDEEASEKALKDLKESYQNQSDSIDKIISKYSSLRDSVNNTAENQSGTSQVNTYTEGIKSAKQEIKYLENEISKLNKIKISDAFTQDDYDSRLKNLQSALSEARISISDFMTSISDSIKDEEDDILDAIEDGNKKSIEAREKEKEDYADIIQAQKDLIDLKNEQAEYEKSIAEKTKEISDIELRKIELQKAASTGDRQAQAEIKKLDEELAKNKEDLTDTQQDHADNLAKDALDKALEDNNSIADAKIEAEKSDFENKKANIQKLYDQEIELISKASQYTKTEFAKALSEITSGLSENGIVQSDDYINSILNGQKYAAGTSDNLSTGDISNKSSILSILQNGKGTGAGNSKLNTYVKENYGGQLSYKQMAQIAPLLGISGVTASNIKDDTAMKDEILKKLKAASFSSGGVIKSSSTSSGSLSELLASIGEKKLIAVKDDERTLSQQQTLAFDKMVDMMPSFISSMQLATPNISNLVTNHNSSPIINLGGINITGNADTKTVSALNSSANNIVKQIMDKVRVS